MDFLPYDFSDPNLKPVTGAPKVYPDGFYLLRIVDTSRVEPEKTNPEHVRRWYQSEIVLGPGWSQEYAGKKFSDRLRLDPSEGGRHFDLFIAAFGSEQAVRQMAAQNGGRVSPAQLQGRFYIAELSVNGTFNNVNRRLPYTEEAWKEIVGTGATTNLMQPVTPGFQAQAPAPAPVQPPMMQAPQMPQMQAPQMPQMQAPQAPQMPQMQAPQMPQVPQMQAPQVQGPQVPQMQAPRMPAFPAPPPPPGTTAGGNNSY